MAAGKAMHRACRAGLWVILSTCSVFTGWAAHGELIALSAFFNQPNFSSPALSPDGSRIAYIAQVGKHQIIGIQTFGGSEPALIGRNSDQEYRWYHIEWANNERLLVSAQTLYRSPESLSKTRYRATRLMGINADGSKDVILGKKWPRAGFSAVQYQDRVLHLWPDERHRVLIDIRQLDKRYAALHSLDIRSGRIRQIEPGIDGVMHHYADTDGIARVGTGLFDGFMARGLADEPFKLINLPRTDEADSELDFAGFSRDPDILWVWDTVDDFSVLRQLRISDQSLIGEPLSAPGYDVRSVMTHPNERVVVGYTYTDTQLRYVYTDESIKALYEPVLNALPGTDTALVSTDHSGQKGILHNSGDAMPPHYYLYDRSGDAPKLSPLGRQYPALPVEQLATTRAFDYTASDGQAIMGFLTVPPGVAEKQLPLVVLPHGGPVARDRLSYDAEVQFLASRGYAVFRMNFRGSYGYGHSFRLSAYEDWGGRMQQDITDGVHHLIAQDIADPDRIAIFGSSYGGYAALMGGIKTPELYQAVASYAGVTHLQWLENEAAEGLRRFSRVFKSLDRKQLAALSPALSAGSMKPPVLIGHGELDERVHVRHSRRMAEALRNADKAVEYLEFEDEIHGFLLQENRLRWYATLEAFLAEHIGDKRDL